MRRRTLLGCLAGVRQTRKDWFDMNNQAKGKRRFPWGALVLAFIVVVVLRVNLPPRDVSGALDLPQLEKEDWFTKAAAGTAAKIVLSDAVAGWKYIDLLVVRVAESERLDAAAVGFPFCRWRVFSR